jgi:hypothetical protein
VTPYDARRRLEAIQQEIRERWARGEWPELAYEPYPCGPEPGAAVMAIGLIQRPPDEMPAAVAWVREVFRDADIPTVHVTCVVKSAAVPGRRPTWEEVAAFLPYLRSEVLAVAPRVLAPMGAEATDIVTRSLRPDLPVFPLPAPDPGTDDVGFRAAVRELAVYLRHLS